MLKGPSHSDHYKVLHSLYNSLRPLSKQTIIGWDNGLSPGRRQAICCHYLNQCWNIVNWTPGNKIQWNFNQNSYIFIQGSAFKNGVWKMAAILSWPWCVNVNIVVMACICRILWPLSGDVIWHHITYISWSIFIQCAWRHWTITWTIVD